MLPRRTGPTHYNALQCGTYKCILYMYALHRVDILSNTWLWLYNVAHISATSWDTLHRVTLQKMKFVALKNATNILYRSNHALCTNCRNRSMKRKTKSSFYEMCTIPTTLQWWIGAHCTSYVSPPIAMAGIARFRGKRTILTTTAASALTLLA